jgi:hypothetical protein
VAGFELCGKSATGEMHGAAGGAAKLATRLEGSRANVLHGLSTQRDLGFSFGVDNRPNGLEARLGQGIRHERRRVQ